MTEITQFATSNTFRFIVASSFLSRLKGLLLKSEDQVNDGEILCLVPCRSIHTLGMKFSIDVAFIDKDGVVQKSFRDLPPNKFLSCRGSSWVCERKATRDFPWPQPGQTLSLCFYSQYQDYRN